jgi:hypothetical protein
MEGRACSRRSNVRSLCWVVPLGAALLVAVAGVYHGLRTSALLLYVGLAAAAVAGRIAFPGYDGTALARVLSFGLAAVVGFSYEATRPPVARARPHDVGLFIVCLIFLEQFFFRAWAPYPPLAVLGWTLLTVGLGVSFRVGSAPEEKGRHHIRSPRVKRSAWARLVPLVTGLGLLVQAYFVLAVGGEGGRRLHPAGWLLAVGVGGALVMLAMERRPRRRAR